MKHLLDLGRAEPIPALSPLARAEIRKRLTSSPAPEHTRAARWIVTAAAIAAGATAFVLTANVAAPLRPHDVIVASGNVARISERGRFEAVIVGPARVTMNPRGAASLELHEGRLVARARETVTVITPQGSLVVSPEHPIDIEVREGRSMKVAGFSAYATALLDGSAPVVTSLAPEEASPQSPPPPSPPAAEHVRHRRTETPSAAEPPTPPTPQHDVAAELLASAIRAYRQDHDADRALTLLDQVASQDPSHRLEAEATVVRVDILVSAGRRADALALLDHARLDALPQPRKLMVLRADLRAEAGRHEDAERDYTAALSGPDDAIAERALWGRAACRSRRGDTFGARADLLLYVQRFPKGEFADAARRAISSW